MTCWTRHETGWTRSKVSALEGTNAVLTTYHMIRLFLLYLSLHLIGLHRQNELTVKEPFRVVLDRANGKTILDVIGLGGSFVPAEDDDEEGDAEGPDGSGDDEGEERNASKGRVV